MPTYKLNYFNVRGLGEIVRLIFTYSGQKFEDNRLPMPNQGDTWSKYKLLTPFGQVPVLEVDGESFAQTSALANFLAREFGLYGKTNKDALQIDQVVAIIIDFRNAVMKVKKEGDETKKAEFQKKMKEEDGPKFMGFLEGLLKKSGTGYFVGSSVTLADLVVFDHIWNLNSDHPEALSNSPLVKAHLETIGAIPSIKAYVAARPDTQF